MIFWIAFILMMVVASVVLFGECCYKKWRKERRKYDPHWRCSTEEMYRQIEKQKEIDASWYGKIGDFWKYHRTPFLTIMGALIAVLVMMLICICVTYGTALGNEAKYEARYESLMYQYENAIFEKDSDIIGNKQLYDEIREYNEAISVGKTYANDFWWGIFWADYYNDLPLIELNQ